MTATLRQSQIRLYAGLGLLVLTLAVAIFVLPDASDELSQKTRLSNDARAALDRQKEELVQFRHLSEQVKSGQAAIETLEKGMPKGSVGELQWAMSRTLHDLATSHGVRLQSVKYGIANRESSKGTDLESIDVEFTALGVYSSLKPFMLALENSGQGFAVGAARLEESPEGARLGVTLRAFRQGEPSARRGAGEES
jgi:Tfp pilus assembly protein PilO